MRYDEPPPWAKRQETWWTLYGRMVKFCIVMAGFILLPLAVLFFVDQTQAIERLKVLGIGAGICSAVLFPAAWFYNRRDDGSTLEQVEKQQASEAQHQKVRVR